MTVDLEDRIRRALDDVAGHVDYSDDPFTDLAPVRIRHRPVRAVLAAGLVAAAVAGIALAVGSSASHDRAPATATAVAPSSTTGVTTTSISVTPSDPATRAALATWSTFPADGPQRPLVLIDGLVDAPAHGFTDPDIAVADAQKEAFDAGAVSTPATLPAGPSTTGGYPIIGAADALARLRASGSGTASTTLTTTDVRLGTATFETDRGSIELPAWIVSFQDVSDPAAVLAVASSALYEPPSGPVGSALMSARRTADPRVLTVLFTGGAAGTGPCSTSYEAHIAESSSAVAVSVDLVPPTTTTTSTSIGSGGTILGCVDIGYSRQLTITLRDPLGARPLVDARHQGAIRLDP